MNSDDVFACPTIFLLAGKEHNIWKLQQCNTPQTMNYCDFSQKPSNQIAAFIQNSPKAMGSGVGFLEGNERRHHWHYFRGRSCKIKLIVAGVLGTWWGISFGLWNVWALIRQTGSCFWTVPTGSSHVKWLVGEFVFLEGICWDILFILT